jgi:D-arabinose 1-dehydrogenase-like Zn-dependent alcohol dehydrogenase
LARNGQLLTAGAHADELVTLDARLLYHRHQRIIGATGAGRTDAEAALAAAAQGKLK